MALGTKSDSRAEAAVPPKLQPGAATERLQFMAPVTLSRRIQEWRRKHPDLPSMSEAMRMLIEQALAADGEAEK